MYTPTTPPDPTAAPTTGRIVVLGASGGIGSAITRELASRGHDVVGTSRSGTFDPPAGVATRAADLLDAVSAKEAVADADVVVLAAQPPYPRWLADWPTMLEHTLAAVEAAGARLVFVDNLYAYAPAAGAMSPDSPEHATDDKGRLRAELGQRVLEAHREGRVRAAIGRFSDYMGPGGTNSGLYMTGISAALRGRTMRGFVDLDQPHAYAYLPDAARGFTTLVEDERADGRVWVLPHHHATQRELLGMVGEAAGTTRTRIGRIRPAMLWLAGLFDAQVRETRSVVVQYDRPWVTDSSAFEATFGPHPLTPLDEAIDTTVAWFRDHPQQA